MCNFTREKTTEKVREDFERLYKELRMDPAEKCEFSTSSAIFEPIKLSYELMTLMI